MNTISFYQAELDYRREQMRRDRQPIRLWRRTGAVTGRRTAPAE
jgi:hypothetical protein